MVDILDYVEKRKEELKNKVSQMDYKPKLVVVQIGNDKASSSYIKSKRKLCDEIGIELKHVHIEDYKNISEKEMMRMIFKESTDLTVDGIILQLPIPNKYDLKELQKQSVVKKT